MGWKKQLQKRENVTFMKQEELTLKEPIRDLGGFK